MFRTPLLSSNLVLLCCLLLVDPAIVQAEDGDPLAIRKWPGGMLSLESHWGFHVAVDPTEKALKQLPSTPDQIVLSSDAIDHYLTRKPNFAKAAWVPSAEFTGKDPNAIHIKSLPSQVVKASSLMLEADGARVVFVPDECLATPAGVPVDDIKPTDLLVLSASNASRLTDPGVISLVKRMAPRLVLLNDIDASQMESAEKFRKAIDAREPVTETDHNTLAFSQSGSPEHQTQVVVLSDVPWQMPDELATLFAGIKRITHHKRSSPNSRPSS